MLDEKLFDLMSQVEALGVWLSVLAWLVVACGAVIMARALRGERRRGVWISATLVGAFALTANLADYAVTLHRSPDLGMEANPLWRNVVDRWGLQVAKGYGLTGKILVELGRRSGAPPLGPGGDLASDLLAGHRTYLGYLQGRGEAEQDERVRLIPWHRS